jgi:hypothetical protein
MPMLRDRPEIILARDSVVPVDRADVAGFADARMVRRNAAVFASRAGGMVVTVVGSSWTNIAIPLDMIHSDGEPGQISSWLPGLTCRHAGTYRIGYRGCAEGQTGWAGIRFAIAVGGVVIGGTQSIWAQMDPQNIHGTCIVAVPFNGSITVQYYSDEPPGPSATTFRAHVHLTSELIGL